MSPDLPALEGSILQAIVQRDWDALRDDLLSDDFVITTAGWLAEPASKDVWLEGLQGHVLDRFEITALDVRDLGDVAVALVLSTQSGSWTGGRFSADFRYTDVWRQTEGGRWLLEVRHATMLPSAAPDDG